MMKEMELIKMKKENTRMFEPALTASQKKYIMQKNGVRITALSDYLLRVETQTGSVFCDDATQCVMCRNFADPAFSTEKQDENTYLIKTGKCTFRFDFHSKKMMYVVLEDGRKVTDFDQGNLKGTCRTLDGTNGRTKLSPGIVSKNGVAVLDDSGSLIIRSDGQIVPRKCKGSDLYFFAHGYKYEEALKDYFRLTGFPPLIPRFALGNWWSRYKAYTQDEYIALMKKFIAKKIPITVATVDMDWHWVKVVEKFGKDAQDKKDKRGVLELFYNFTNPGWTGYSWNTDLFPQPKAFLQWLKEHNFKVTMNLHPASGCKFYEDAYKEFCAFMGIDPESKKQIHFDITDPKFMEGYFRFLHHPLEEDGVDFWWIDWQQGTKTGIPGLDPLWALNHYHYLDNGRNSHRPLILSRFAGAGSHRYPLGFSGDTAQSWPTLDFQPYFTATASNIGYTWWSHDIGGHHFGERDDELYLRWVQFGVFSPIMRLHSTSNEFMGKEPWKYRADVEYFATKALRFRHRMIPYIYTANRLTAEQGIPLVRPMYYSHPEDERAYQAPNQYYFGAELIVCPITKKTDAQTGLAGVKVFLPEGRYTDIFNGRIYTGNREAYLYRDESAIPVLAREGAIIPLSMNDTKNDSGNPTDLELLIYRGTNSYTLYEDDGYSNDYLNGAFAETVFSVSEKENSLCITAEKAKGDLSVLPQKRNYLFTFRDITNAEKTEVTVNGAAVDFHAATEEGCLQIGVENVLPTDRIDIALYGIFTAKNDSIRELKTELISKLQGSNNAKNRFNRVLDDDASTTAFSALKGPLSELTALYYET